MIPSLLNLASKYNPFESAEQRKARLMAPVLELKQHVEQWRGSINDAISKLRWEERRLKQMNRLRERAEVLKQIEAYVLSRDKAERQLARFRMIELKVSHGEMMEKMTLALDSMGKQMQQIVKGIRPERTLQRLETSMDKLDVVEKAFDKVFDVLAERESEALAETHGVESELNLEDFVEESPPGKAEVRDWEEELSLEDTVGRKCNEDSEAFVSVSSPRQASPVQREPVAPPSASHVSGLTQSERLDEMENLLNRLAERSKASAAEGEALTARRTNSAPQRNASREEWGENQMNSGANGQAATEDAFAGIIGMAREKAKIEEALRLYRARDLYPEFDAGLKRADYNLLIGPPGTGKTTLARAAAKRLGVRFFELSMEALLSTNVANTQKAILQAFDELPRGELYVLLVDEIDSIARKGLGGVKAAAAEALRLGMDRLSDSGQAMILFGCTNEERDALLDRITSRFGGSIYVLPPDEASRAAYLGKLFDEIPCSVSEAVDVAELARRYEGRSMRDLTELKRRLYEIGKLKTIDAAGAVALLDPSDIALAESCMAEPLPLAVRRRFEQLAQRM